MKPLKKISFVFYLLSFFSIELIGQTQCPNEATFFPTGTVECPSGEYYLVFHDEFNGNHVNESIWNLTKGTLKPYDRIFEDTHCGGVGGEDVIFLEDNVIVNDGLLKLRIKHESYTYHGVVENSNEPNTCYGSSCGSDTNTEGCDYPCCSEFVIHTNFTGGLAITKQGWEYGIYEARAKVPNKKGFWPAFWLWHHDEIDIFEFFGETDVFKTNYWNTCVIDGENQQF